MGGPHRRCRRSSLFRHRRSSLDDALRRRDRRHGRAQHGGVLGARHLHDARARARRSTRVFRARHRRTASTSISTSTRPTIPAARSLRAHRRRRDPHRLPRQDRRSAIAARSRVQPDDEADATIDRVAEAGIAVVSLPMCNMYLQDRVAGRTPRWRGVTLLHELTARGVPVAVASDNTRDPFYAYGDLDMLEVFREAMRILHLDHPVGDWPTHGRPRARPRSSAGRITASSPPAARPTSSSSAPAAGPSCCPVRSPTAPCCAPARPIDRTLPDYRELDDLMGRMTHDRHRASEGRARRHQDRGQSGDREAEEPRLLLVLAGAEAPARPRHRRPRRLAEERGRGHRASSTTCYRARRAGHAARLRHRQLRPGDAALRRRRAQPRRHERGEVDRAAAASSPRPAPILAEIDKRDARQSRPGTAPASLDLQHRLDRRLHRRRLGRRRLDQLGRPARPRQRARACASSPWRPTPRVLELDGLGPAQGDARLRHQRHHHRGRDAARRRL